MTSRGHSLVTGVSHTADTQADLYYPKTFALAAYELAASPCPPQGLKRPQSVARSARKSDRALFPAICSALKPAQISKALLNVLLVGGAVGMIVVMATIALVVPYLVFFAEF